MGIAGLWNVSYRFIVVSKYVEQAKLLEPAAQVVNLRELSTVEGFQRNFRGNHMLHIGIDI